MFRVHCRVPGLLLSIAVLLAGCSALYKADVKLEKGEYGQAITLYKEYLGKHPDSAEAQSRLGLAQLRSGQTDMAIAEFKSVLARSPKDPISNLYLGIAYLYKGNLRDGIAFMEQYMDEALPLVQDEVNYQLSLLRPKLSGTPLSGAEVQAIAKQTDDAVALAMGRQREEDQRALQNDIGGGAGGGCGC
jgi:tetratricopeptide (TPR) repeat protein